MAEIAKEPIRSSTLSGSDSECEPLEELNNVAELDPPSPDDIFVVDKVVTSKSEDSSKPKTRFEAEFSNFLSKSDDTPIIEDIAAADSPIIDVSKIDTSKELDMDIAVDEDVNIDEPPKTPDFSEECLTSLRE